MRKFLIFVSVAVLFTACGNKVKSVKLESGTNLYNLAKELSVKAPLLDPEINAVLVTTNKFDVTIGDVFSTFQLMYGDGVEKLREVDAAQLVQVFKDNAVALSEKKLMLAAAQAAKIKVADAEVDSILAMQYAQIGGKEKFINYLNNVNISLEALQNDIRDNILINKYIEEKLSDSMKVTDADVEQFYKSADQSSTVRHILLLTQGKSDQEKMAAYEKINGLLLRARQGENFETLAKQYSEDPGSKSNGGLYRDIRRGDMVKPFEEAAFTVPVGQISDIIETQYGFHILKVIERKKETRPLEKVRRELEEQVKMAKQGTVLSQHIEKLKTEAEFKIKS